MPQRKKTTEFNLVDKTEVYKNDNPISQTANSVFEYLPKDIVYSILLKLDHLEDIFAFALTNRKYKHVLSDNVFWMFMAKQYFPHINHLNFNLAKFMKVYKLEYQGLSKKVIELFSMAKRGDFDSFKTNHFKWEDLQHSDSRGFTPLNWLYHHKNQSIFNYLYSAINNSHLRNIEWAIRLHQTKDVIATMFLDSSKYDYNLMQNLIFITTKSGNKSALEFLLDKADSNLKTRLSQGKNPMLYACQYGHLELIKLLLQHMPTLSEITDSAGQTPILWAASRGHDDIISYLADLGVDLNLLSNEDVKGYSALHFAALGGYTQCTRVLIEKGAQVNIQARSGVKLQPIHLAAEHGHLDSIKLLLQKDQSLLNAADGYLQTPLLWAASTGQVEVVEYLLQQGADFTITDIRKYSPLHWAAKRGHADVARLLIQNGADKDLKAGENMTPLLVATNAGHEEVVKTLAAFGADINAQNNVGDDALHIAAKNKNITMARTLVKLKINVTSLSKDGKKCFEVAPDDDTQLILKLLTFSRTIKSAPEAIKKAKAPNLPHRKISNEKMLVPVKALKHLFFKGGDVEAIKAFKKDHGKVLNRSEFRNLYKKAIKK